MKKIANIIVKLNNIILVIFALLIVYSVSSIDKVNVEYSITSYLPDGTDTKLAIDIMDNEFTTFGSSTMVIKNIPFDEAQKVVDQIEEIEGVKEIPFENTPDYYNSSSALLSVTYDGTSDDQICIDAYNKVLEIARKYDTYVSASLVDDYADELQSDINRILILAIVIIVIVLTFTSKSYFEVLVFLIVFGVSAALNMGTNYWFGTISFVSNSVCIILQLALAIDYAIIISHRFAEEKENGLVPFEAMSEALSKGIPEVFGSSLTTIAGLLALTCMTLKLGADLGMVLAKSIVCSMFTVFLLMPSLMLLFSKAIDKTTHKNFVPKITLFGKGVLKTRFITPIIFLVLIVAGALLSFNITYVYSMTSIDTSKPTESMQASDYIEEVFGSKNQFVVLVPKGEYNIEREVISTLEEEDLISDIIGISNVEITNNGKTFYLTQDINYKDFASLLGISEKQSKNLFLIYACFKTDDSINEMAVFEANPDIYMTCLLDIIDCALDHNDFIEAYLYNYPDKLDDYHDVKTKIEDAKKQLIGTNYTRIVCNVLSQVESKDTFDLIDRLNKNVKSITPGIIFAGDSMSSYDLNSSFVTDNLLISLLTIIFVYVILMLTLNSWGVPLLLVATIQGAVFINFGIPVIEGSNLYFFVYLIVSAIQMGATIDYAIVITNRYQALYEVVGKKQAVIDTLNQSFPTIITSGTILTSASFLIYYLVGDPLISTLGLALGRGTLISIFSVMCILPVLLYFFYGFLSKTKLPKYDLKSIKSIKILKEIKNENK